jgi:hypothetical protein
MQTLVLRIQKEEGRRKTGLGKHMEMLSQALEYDYFLIQNIKSENNLLKSEYLWEYLKIKPCEFE